MRKWRFWLYAKLPVVTAAFIVVATAVPALAITSSSPNYQVIETQFNAGSNYESCSGQYCAQVSLGDVSDPGGLSTAAFDETQHEEPVLEMIVERGASNLGTLSPDRTSTKTMTVKVRNYQSGSGYMLQIMGDPPKFGDHTLSTPSVPTQAAPGTEQFGLNVAANTTPEVGKMPKQVPDTDGIFGEATPNYRTPNLFMYKNGDVVARGLTASGRTDYTISMIVNISASTPPGRYAGDFAAILVPVY